MLCARVQAAGRLLDRYSRPAFEPPCGASHNKEFRDRCAKQQVSALGNGTGHGQDSAAWKTVCLLLRQSSGVSGIRGLLCCSTCRFVDEATAMGLDGHFSLDAQLVSALDGARPELLGKPQNHLTVSNLAELIEAVQAEEAPGRWTREVINVVAKRAGKVPAPPPSLRLLSQILSEQQNGGTMVDAFAELFPSAQGRYTCWDQYTNMR
eukprot:SAG31_NODE_2024_length_6644_cov_7.943621_5_plen_208_part_00